MSSVYPDTCDKYKDSTPKNTPEYDAISAALNELKSASKEADEQVAFMQLKRRMELIAVELPPECQQNQVRWACGTEG